MTGDDDAQRLEERRAADRTIQHVINGLVDGAKGSDPRRVAAAVKAGLENAGMMGMPAPWIEAVAEGLAQGNAYVVSPYTQEHEDIPPPETHVPSRTID